jgi:hypothetical protein
MSIVGQKVHWYRNESEKDNNVFKGTGRIVQFTVLERSMEALAVIESEEGNFVTKPLVLIKRVEQDELDHPDWYEREQKDHPDWFDEDGTMTEEHPNHSDYISPEEEEILSEKVDAEVTKEGVIDTQEARDANPQWYNPNGSRNTDHPEYEIPF